MSGRRQRPRWQEAPAGGNPWDRAPRRAGGALADTGGHGVTVLARRRLIDALPAGADARGGRDAAECGTDTAAVPDPGRGAGAAGSAGAAGGAAEIRDAAAPASPTPARALEAERVLDERLAAHVADAEREAEATAAECAQFVADVERDIAEMRGMIEAAQLRAAESRLLTDSRVAALRAEHARALREVRRAAARRGGSGRPGSGTAETRQ